MSRLRIFAENDPSNPRLSTSDHAEMAVELKKIGVAFEQWQANAPVAPGDAPEKIMEAYRTDIDRLVAQHGFGVGDERPRHRDPLHLPAGHFVREVVGAVAHVHQFEALRGAGEGRAAVRAAQE